jgi:hypothetical protein
MIVKYGKRHYPQRYAIFYYGGVSTRPSLAQAFWNMRIDLFFGARVKLLLKAIFIVIGLEWVNKSILVRTYR